MANLRNCRPAIFSITAQRALANQDPRLWARLAILAPLLLLPAAVAAFTLRVFRFDYSVFGKLRRRPLPLDAPAETVRFSYLLTGRARVGPAKWLFYPDGVGIKIDLIGDVFLPRDEIETIEIGAGFMGYMSIVWHHSPELKAPIQPPNRVANIMGSHYPEKLLAPAYTQDASA